MKHINDYLKRNVKELNYDQLIDQFMEHPLIQKFIMDHDLKHDDIVKGINTLLTFKDENDLCHGCKGIDDCRQDLRGYKPRLVWINNRIDLEYAPCDYQNRVLLERNIDALFVPKKIFEANIEDFDMVGESRKTILKYMNDFLRKFSRDNYMKGMSISGEYGTGKTYALAAISNELARKGYKVLFAYYPDLVREIKSSINTGLLESKINKLKNADILCLDDLGGEFFSRFIRDEVLGPILQHRLMDEKPTFFTSNLSYQELAKIMKDSDTSKETMNALRVVQRIKRLTEPFKLNEKPRML